MAGQVLELLQWQYVAHVVYQDGTVTELRGTAEGWTQGHVYNELVEAAKELNGWLSGCHIVELEDDDPPWTPNTTPIVRTEQKEEASVWADSAAFGVYKSKYKGAALCTYKVEKDDVF
jgi:hypothetical protein